MQYLMVLLVSAGVLVLMLSIALGISYGLGAMMRARGPRMDASDADPCAGCQADRDWYEALPVWKRSLIAVWWLANRYQCVAKDCG